MNDNEQKPQQDVLFENLVAARKSLQQKFNNGSLEVLAGALRVLGDWLRSGGEAPSSPCPEWLFWGSIEDKRLACRV